MALLSRILHHGPEKESPSISRNSSSNGLSPSISGGSTFSNHSSPHFSLEINLESPPVILYGPPSESTGSIISGILTLEVKAPSPTPSSSLSLTPKPSRSSQGLSPVMSASMISDDLELETVTISLVQTMRYSKTFSIPSNSLTSCKDCNTRTTTLARWDVLSSPTTFPIGSHAYPFSHLLPGSLPPTSKLGSSYSNCYIKYELIATGKKTGSNKETKVKIPVNIMRSLLRGPDRNSLRVFPPTDVTASAVLPNVVYPKSSFPVELKLDNIVSKNNERRWRMRKLSWRIDENTRVRAHSCPKHTPKLKALEESHKKTALLKELSSSGNSKPSGNLHHSTIQSSMTYLTNPSGAQQSQAPQSPQVETAVNEDEPEVASAPLNTTTEAHQSFVEDFVPSANTASSHNPTHQNSQLSPQVSPQPSNQNEGHLYLEEIRTVTHGEIKSGWKSDFSGRGRIELVADISAANFATGFHTHISKRNSDVPNNDDKHLENLRNSANVACDIDDPTLGIYVSHNLVVEIVVAEELVQSLEKSSKKRGLDNNLTPVSSTNSANESMPGAQASVGVPTGAARVLRMQFKIHLTERSGLGIAWDDEVPPTYEDVRTLSPPTYQETSRASTPVSTPQFGSSHISPPPQAAHRITPGVLYGVGNTPASFGAPGSSALSIDQLIDLDDRIQDLTI